MTSKGQPLPPGHIFIPSLAIGSLALALAGGLGALGFLERLDRLAGNFLQQGGVSHFPRVLPLWVIWISTAVIAYGLAAAILGVPCVWRRLVLWFSTLAMIVFWIPVLGLAALQPSISAALIAALWSGVCGLVYAHGHHMPVDPPSSKQPPLEDSHHGES